MLRLLSYDAQSIEKLTGRYSVYSCLFSAGGSDSRTIVQKQASITICW